MNIEMYHMIWLVLLPFVIGWVWYQAKKGRFSSGFQKKLYISLRTVICLLLILAMTEPNLIWTSRETTTIFAIDRSASAADCLAEETAFLQAAQENRTKKDSAGILSFGAGSMVEQMPSKESDLTAPLFSAVDEGGSDLAGALRLASSMMSERGAKRVVLLSDGNETTGDVLAQADLLAQQGAVLDVYLLQKEEKPEVQLTNMELSPVISKNTRYEIGLQIDATVDTEATVRLYKENSLIAEEQVNIRSGESRMVFSDLTKEGGAVTYRAEIESKDDTLTQNNRVYAYTYIEDVPRILIIEQENSGRQWAALLSGSQVAVEQIDAPSAPVAQDILSKYDGIILADVSMEMLPKGWAEAAETYVRTTGGGILVSGGENAFALGGYKDTVLEEMLPVDMDLKTEGQEPDLTMIMVVDRSGSMEGGSYGITRIDMAKEAVIRSLANFQEGDRVGVIAFDEKANWVVEPQEVTAHQKEMENAVAQIQAMGGTSILPALQMAYDAMMEENTKQKHILLLTDGQAEQTGYEKLLGQMEENGITLSTVAVGEESDQRLLELLAEKGKGRYYYTDVFSDLPEIFAKETVLAGKEFLNNRSFYPEEKDASVILDGIDAVPKLHGYVATTAKSRADTILISDEEEPILAAWQYGLGRTAVWTSDVDGRWTSDWLASSEGAAILKNTVSWVLKSPIDESLRLTAQAGQENTSLRLEMPYDEQIQQVAATVIENNGKQHEVTFSMTKPGVYEGVLPTAAEGAYVAAVQKEKKDGTKEVSNTGFHISYAAEYDMTKGGDGEEVLRQAAQRTGGRVLSSGAEVFRGEVPEADSVHPLQKIFLVLALILFLLDIALHRFTVLTSRLEFAAQSLRLQISAKKKKKKRKNADIKEKQKQEFPKEPPVEAKEELKTQIRESAKEEQTTLQRLAASKKKRGK